MRVHCGCVGIGCATTCRLSLGPGGNVACAAAEQLAFDFQPGDDVGAGDLKNYFARFAGVRRYMDETKQRAKELGYVETAQADIVRDSLIGAAPLITGTICVAYIAFYQLEVRLLLDVFRAGQLNLFWLGISALPTVQDFYLWFYLAFAISSTMMALANCGTPCSV